MKHKLTILISISLTIIFMSCRSESSQRSDQPSDGYGLNWEQLFKKDQMNVFHFADFSSDSEYFLTVHDYSDLVRSWRKPFKTPVGETKLKNYTVVTTARFAGDQNDIYVIEKNGKAHIWDKDMQTKKFEYLFSNTSLFSAISEDGRFLAACGQLYDRQKKKIVGRDNGHAVDKAASFGGKTLLLTAGFHDKSIAVRDIYSGKVEEVRASNPIYTAAISQNEKYIAAVTKKSRCYFWNWPDQTPKIVRLPKGRAVPIAFSPDSKWFAVYSPSSKYLHLFGTDPFEEIKKIKMDQDYLSIHAATENLIFMCTRDQGFVHIYDVSAEKIIARHRVFSSPVEHLKFIPADGTLWVAGGGTTRPQKSGAKPGAVALYRIKGIERFLKTYEPKK